MKQIQQEQSNHRPKYTLDDILEKEQFKIKLNVRYFLFSGSNLTALVFAYLIGSSNLTFCCIYIFSALVAYKFLFNLTKDGKHYQPLLIRKYANLMKELRSRSVRKQSV